MIKRLDVENLRSFRDPAKLRFSNITLIYGPNSAGKSTLLQALAVLKQTGDATTRARVRGGELGRLALQGELVNLGSYRTAIHGHKEELNLRLGVVLAERSGSEQLYAGLEFEHDVAGARQTAVEIGDPKQRIRFKRNATKRGNEFRLAATDRRALAEFLRKDIERGRLGDLREDEARTVADALSSPSKSIMRFTATDLFPGAPAPGWFKDRPLVEYDFTTWWVNNVYADVTEAFERDISRLEYLGPIRVPPTRVQTRFPDASSGVGLLGSRTAELLHDNPALLERVNKWLFDLDIRYTLSIQEVRPAHASGNANTKKKVVEIGDLFAIALEDRGGTAVTPQDVGYGISQLLPIILQLLVNEDSVICIEQPEVHIHPRLQAHLGDLLIQSSDPAGKNRNQVIVETHSEQLALRLQRRIRKIPGDESDYDWVTNTDVSLLYVGSDQKTGRAWYKQLDLDRRGSMIEGWPPGFFGERLEELRGGKRPDDSEMQ
ncbi:MAG: hypothetical protein QOJ29_67 [Thermoleophilaceae bacterium]|jgi:predicted ATPase|nr:hypothetical protein [Thermoleophilaceae bacterium]